MPRQRRKKGRPVSGWLVFDKPLGMGSTDAVSKIKWLFKAEKAGHAGTLDPLASGILPIALGEATKTVPYVMDGAKVYRFTVEWGAETATDDAEGDVLNRSGERPSLDAVEAILPDYTGTIQQKPPAYSAIKVGGERAYDLAREGAPVDIPAREVEIDSLSIVSHDEGRTAFEVECGKGTYVRSLARDMGRQLGCYGHVVELRRTVVDPFDEEDAVTLEEIEKAVAEAEAGIADDAETAEDERLAARFAALDPMLLDTGEAMHHYPQVAVGGDQAQRIRLGNPVILRGRDAPLPADDACAFERGKLLAIGQIAEGEFRPRRVFKT
ncbi:tRNA pseudouridine(55) synthase TruB [Oricola cellulosilytica]|uniref:tRNA pseudouridine synthase B n=1 Tax=Oricola cellulosilytica TaxID=1429082 RepID=A0A4R0PEV2_9HYPH|nr:tRNA pseudouridine(55) synthase TruB [Oricola cellulosilytica]TCD16346.1 tRNA pseudouridine(55) synthase TruB [Oricola cellulosilytica]